jgi:hypothetical protein
MTPATTLLFEQKNSVVRITWSIDVSEREEICEQICRFHRIQHWADMPVLLCAPHLRAVIPQCRGKHHWSRCPGRYGGMALYTRLLAKDFRTPRGASGNYGDLSESSVRPAKQKQ